MAYQTLTTVLNTYFQEGFQIDVFLDFSGFIRRTLTFLISLKNIFLHKILLTFDNYDKSSFNHFSPVLHFIWRPIICFVEQNKLLFFGGFFLSEFSFTNIHDLQGSRGRGEAISLIPLYHFHPLQRHLDISRAITAESSTLYIACSRTRTGNLWFPSASH